MCLPASIALLSKSARIWVVAASKKTSSLEFFSAASRSVVERSMPYCRASAASFSALRPTNIGSGITRSPFGTLTPPCARIATIERTRCWLSPMRPVTPTITMPSLRTAKACSRSAVQPAPREAKQALRQKDDHHDEDDPQRDQIGKLVAEQPRH